MDKTMNLMGKYADFGANPSPVPLFDRIFRDRSGTYLNAVKADGMGTETRVHQRDRDDW